MKKATGFAALAILFALFAASNALADGIQDGHDHDSSSSSFAFEGSTAATHDAATIHDAANVTDQDKDQDSDHSPKYDHVLAWSPNQHPDHDKDPKDPKGPKDADGSDPAMPEAPTVLLLAAGLTPFLWVRRKGGGI